MIHIRPAVSADEEYLYQLYCSTRKSEIEAFCWDEDQERAFLSMQWAAQTRSYAAQFPLAEHSIVMYGETKAGRTIVDRGEQAFVLVDISLLPDFQNRGIGTLLLRELQIESCSCSKRLCLSVLSASRAVRLYERLGFRTAVDDGYRIAMEWAGAV
ncbi:GNAT family N-acetyltransferase [Paenibacillus sp. DMB20]|uniref:GNAT family N-acetyltransferase n=1 Tax=Paenibacillus sp. DMB20 TaxID=1642570 RepID=UPI000627CEDB|nr:GNAT family N-acetyltransferase [Paenibacillus sp. DMB20]KKO54596.1 hypothetical protein XI25_05890 [Paenibacillus sp. DMB20]